MPTALSCNQHTVIAGGADLKLAVYSKNGRLLQTEDLSVDPGLREITSMAIGPSADMLAVGAFDAFIGFTYSERDGRWTQSYTKKARIAAINKCANRCDQTAR